MPQEFIVIDHTPGAEKILRKPAKKVSFPLSESILRLIEEMKISIIEADGVGLAASQVGNHIQLIVYHVPKEVLTFREDVFEEVPLSVLINASYTPIPEEGMFSDWEGCFSVHDTMAKVPRYKSIKYEGQTVDGQHITGSARGFLARVLQHEIDHTQGILFIDRLTKDCIQGPEEEMMKIRREEYEERKMKREIEKTKYREETVKERKKDFEVEREPERGRKK